MKSTRRLLVYNSIKTSSKSIVTVSITIIEQRMDSITKSFNHF